MLRLLASLLLCLACAAHAAPVPVLQTPIDLARPGGVLHGSLLLPQPGHPVPVVLILAGSGPTDRDGNNPEGGRNDSLKKLAWGLARAGIASVRYDKRGVAAGLSLAPDERQLSVEAYVEDALAWSRQLHADPRFGPLILLGHSEGALIATLAAPQSPAKGLISIGGSGRPVGQLLEEQLKARLPAELAQQSQVLIEHLTAGQLDDQVPPQLNVVFRPSVQPYLISLFRQDPAKAIAAVKVPVLIVQGRHDIQVSEADARALKAAQPNAKLALIDGMNHVLRIVPMDMKAQLGSYANPNLPLAWNLTPELVKFIDSLH